MKKESYYRNRIFGSVINQLISILKLLNIRILFVKSDNL